MQAQELRADDGMCLFPLQGQFFVLRIVDNEGLVGQHLAQRAEIDHAMAINVHLEWRGPRILLHTEAQEAVQKPANRTLCRPPQGGPYSALPKRDMFCLRAHEEVVQSFFITSNVECNAVPG